METMIVSGRQVNDTVVKLVRRRVRHQLLAVAHTIVLVVALVGECLRRCVRGWAEKLIDGKRSALYLLNQSVADFAANQNLSIARRDDSFLRQWPAVFAQLATEEFRQVLVVEQVLIFS